MSSADRLTYTSSAEKGIPGVSGGLSGSKNGFWEWLGRSKTVRGALAGLGMLGIGARYDQPAPVDIPREVVERKIEDMGMSFWGIESNSMTPESRFWTSSPRGEAGQNDTPGMGDDLKKPNELQQLLDQIDERLRELHPSESVSQSTVSPRSTAGLTSDQVARVLGDGRLTVTIDRREDNFTNAIGRALQEAVGTQLDGRGQWQATVALLGDNGMIPDQVRLVHNGNQFDLQVGEQTTEVLQGADLALGEAALSKLGSDSQPDGVGDPKVDQPETVKVEENSPPADDPKDKEGLPPVSGGGGGTSGGGTSTSGSGASGGSSGGAASGKEAAPGVSTSGSGSSSSDSSPAKEKVPDPEPAKEKVPAPEPAKEKVPSPEEKKEEKPGEEEERSGRPAQPVVPPAAPPVIPPLVPPITGLAGPDTILFDGGVQGESKVSQKKRVVELKITRGGDSIITLGKVSEAPVREADVFLRGQWSRVRTAAVSTDGDFGQLDDTSFAVHSRVDRIQGDRPGPGVIERAVALKGVQAGDQLELTKASGDVETLTVVFKSFDDPQNVGKGEGQVVISTCDPDNMPKSLDDTKRLVIVAQEIAADDSGDNPAPIESGLPLAAVGAMLAARRKEDQERLRRSKRRFGSLFGWEEEIFSALGEVKQEDEA